jgi:hypothetical protein
MSTPVLVGKAAERYNQLMTERAPWEDAAERFSLLTLPSVFPEDAEPVPDAKVVPHNNTGAQGTNTLASKMVLQLLPPNQSFFRMEIRPETLKKVTDAAASADPSVSTPAAEIQTELQESLVDLERRLTREIGRDNLRANAHELFKLLLVTGNALFWVPEKGPTSVLNLRRYGVSRDPAGSLMEIIIREEVAESTLPEEQQAMVSSDAKSPDMNMGNKMPSLMKTVSVYTVAERISDTKFAMWQEIEGDMIPNSMKEYAEDRMPLIVLRWTNTPGEDYGHAYISDFEGDLIVLEALSRAIKEAAVASSRVLFGVSPTAPPGLATQLAKAANGSFHRFSEGDVFALQVNKVSDLNIAAQAGERAEQRLRAAFLLNSTRDAERVTAEEVRQNFQELQAALGGAFAQLSNTFQTPLLGRLMVRLKARGGLAGIEDALTETEPIIITGVDALGRNTEFSNLVGYTQALAQAGLDPREVLFGDELALRLANASSVPPDGLVKPRQVAQQEQQQQAMMQGAVKAAGPVGAAAVRAGAQTGG